MKIRLKHLTLSAFRNFDKDQKVSFRPNQLSAVVAENRDDGGSNGTGKSSMACATIVNLFGPKQVKIPIKELKNRYLKGSASIIGEYDLNGEDLIVERTLGGELKFQHGSRPQVTGSVDDVQKKLETVLGVTPKQFSLLSSKSQGEYGGFLLMGDAEKKEFLSSFFDVTFVESTKESVDKSITAKEKDSAIMEGQRQYASTALDRLVQSASNLTMSLEAMNNDTFKKEMDGLTRQKEDLVMASNSLASVLLQKEIFDGYIESLPDFKAFREESGNRVLEYQKSVTDQEEKLKNSRSAAEEIEKKIKEIPPVPQDLLSQRSQIEAAIKEADKRIAKYQELSLKKSILSQRNFKEELDKAKMAVCHSCGSSLQEHTIKTMCNGIETAQQDFSRQIKTLEDQMLLNAVSSEELVQMKSFKENIDQAVLSFKMANSPDTLNKELASIKSSITSMEYAIRSGKAIISAEHGKIASKIESIRSGIQSDLNAINSQVKNIENTISGKMQKLLQTQSEIDSVQKSIKTSQDEIVSLDEKRIALTEELDILKRISHITSKNGFVGYIFDSILEDLNLEINENLKLIPNARKFSLQFNSDKVVKTTGNVNKNITHQLFSGEDEVIFETLSGGEKLSVILAVDEALDTVISRRLGVFVGWKFLDEQFYWIDENSKEAIMEFYRAKSADKAYIIIDHASEFNAAFDNKITIVKQNNIARFKEM